MSVMMSMSTELQPLTEQELSAVERAAANVGAFGGLIVRLVAEVRRRRSDPGDREKLALEAARLAYHHQQAGLPEQTPELAEAVRGLQNAMDKYRFKIEDSKDPERARAMLDARCRTCAELDGTLAKRDTH